MMVPEKQIEEPATQLLKWFAEKYGSHGYLFDMRNREFLKVNQLDFRSSYYSPGNKACIIPEEYKSWYKAAIFYDRHASVAYESGGQYNFPVEPYIWIKETEVDVAIKIVGYV